MIYQYITYSPNALVDTHPPNLTESELKIILVIIRQTNGWVDKRTGLCKTRDRISNGQFIQKTGLSRRVISKALKNLADSKLIEITCRSGNLLNSTEDRRGKTGMYYSLNMCTKQPEPVHLTTPTCAQNAHNKTNYTKINKTKLRDQKPRRSYSVLSISDLLESSGYKVNPN